LHVLLLALPLEFQLCVLFSELVREFDRLLKPLL
jgi:hypothetical protein